MRHVLKLIAFLGVVLVPSGVSADEKSLTKDKWTVKLTYDSTYKEGETSKYSVNFKWDQKILPGLKYLVTVSVYEYDWSVLNKDDAVECEAHDPKCGACKGGGCGKTQKKKGWEFSFTGDSDSKTMISGTLDLKVDWKKYANLGKAKVYVKIQAKATNVDNIPGSTKIPAFDSRDAFKEKYVEIKKAKD